MIESTPNAVDISEACDRNGGRDEHDGEHVACVQVVRGEVLVGALPRLEDCGRSESNVGC